MAGIRISGLETYAYAASKAAVHHLSKFMASHIACRNITVKYDAAMVLSNANLSLSLAILYPTMHGCPARAVRSSWFRAQAFCVAGSALTLVPYSAIAAGPFESKMMKATLERHGEAIKNCTSSIAGRSLLLTCVQRCHCEESALPMTLRAHASFSPPPHHVG